MFQTGFYDLDSPTPLVTQEAHIQFERYFNGASMLRAGKLTTIVGAGAKAQSRHTAVGDRVDCYRNLNKPTLFSIKQRDGEMKGKVSGYARAIILRNPDLVVSEKSRQRVLSEKSRNVHSFVRAEFVDAYGGDVILSKLGSYVRVSYSPYVAGNFFTLLRNAQGEIIKESIKPFFSVGGYKYAIVNGSDVFLCNL